MKPPRMMLAPLRLEARDCPAVNIRLDYRFDASNFFNTPERRDAMERVAVVLESRLQDSLGAIAPNAALSRTWTATTINTVTNSPISIPNPTIAADEVVVYVAGGAMPGSALAIAAGGGFNTGSFPLGDAWPAIIRGRGQVGALQATATDYAPWGGFIGFDSGVNWNFNAAPPAGSQTDFESVALHEMLHVFGFGLDNVRSFTRYVTADSFIGPNAMAAYGGPVPFGSGDHFANSVTSGGQPSIMVAALPTGTERIITPLDWAVLADIGWQVSGVSPSVPPAPGAPPTVIPTVPPPVSPPADATGAVRFHVGSGTGRAPLAAGLNATGGTVWNVAPFDGSFTGGVRVASADFNGDGVLDVVVGTGPGIAAMVRVLDGATRRELFSLTPFGDFNGGVNVAAGDISGDGRAELFISPDRGGGPRIRVFDGATFTQSADFFGIDDATFRGGARIALGDLSGDGRPDVIVSAGFGGGPRIALFDGARLGSGGGPKLSADFFAFEQNLRNGAFVAAADLDRDGKAELIAGGGPGGGPRVSVFSGAQLLENQRVRLADFFAGDSDSRGGVRLAVFGDRIVTGAGEGGGLLALYDGPAVLGNSNPVSLMNNEYFRDSGGIYVG